MRIDTAELTQLLGPWDLLGPLRIRPIEHGGHASLAWHVRDRNDDEYVAKLIPDRRQFAEPGLRVAAAVGETGIRTGAPVCTSTGELCVDVARPEGPATLALLAFVPGVPLDRESAAASGLAGDLLGRVHAALLERTDPSWVPAQLLVWCRSHALSLPNAQDAVAAVAAVEELALTCSVVYGDPSPEILVDEQTGSAALIDWGTPSWGPLLHDVAVWIDFVGGAEDFLHAYGRHVALHERELGELPRFHILLRALRLREAA